MEKNKLRVKGGNGCGRYDGVSEKMRRHEPFFFSERTLLPVHKMRKLSVVVLWREVGARLSFNTSFSSLFFKAGARLLKEKPRAITEVEPRKYNIKSGFGCIDKLCVRTSIPNENESHSNIYQ